MWGPYRGPPARGRSATFCFALLYPYMSPNVFKCAVVFKPGQRWNSLQAVTLTFESVGN